LQIDSTHSTSADQDQPAHLNLAVWLWSALFAMQLVSILNFSLNMMNGFVQIERWMSTVKTFRVEHIIAVLSFLPSFIPSLTPFQKKPSLHCIKWKWRLTQLAVKDCIVDLKFDNHCH
jgi:hypothetical protein